MCASPVVKKDNVGAIVNRALDAGQGILRLTPNWVPRSFLHPGKRIKLAPTDWYALGAYRGGIDERWFASTTEAANDNRAADEGLSYAVFEGQRFLLRDAVAEAGVRLVGKTMFDKYGRWPVYSKFFDNMGPIPHHMHQQSVHAALTGQQGKPECYYFPPQLNAAENHFDYTFFGLEPGTTKADVHRCLENWSKGDNGILDLSKAYRLKPGTGWMVPAGVLHAPGSMCTYEPQWGSDVFGMYQSLVEGREVPWALLVKDVPADKHHDLDFIVEQLDWEKNVDPCFKQHTYVEPIVDQSASGPGYTDRWIDYGHFNSEQLVSAKELTVEPGAKCVLRDPGASGWITVQGSGRIGKLALQTPVMIHFGEEPWDEVFITQEAAARGVEIENTGCEPLVGLRYFGPDVHKNMPKIGERGEEMTYEHPHNYPKLHNAAWPGVVGKGPGSEPPIDLDTMLDLTADAEFEGIRFDGFDLFLFAPHIDIDSSDAQICQLADKARARNLEIGTVVAPIWGPTGGGAAMGNADEQAKFLAQVRKGCHIAERLRQLGIRPNGVVRIDSASPVAAWYEDPAGNQQRIAATFREACKIAEDHGERLAAEGEICWGGMHSWKRMLQLLEMVDRAQTLGFEADMAHTLLYLLGYNAPEDAILPANFNWRNEDKFEAAYGQLTAALRPWTIDFHIAQSNATVHGSGTHDKTGRHCLPDDAQGKLDIPHQAGYWLRDEKGELTKRIRHVCWDGCMFPNDVMMKRETWVSILKAMIAVRDKHGWAE